MVLHLGVLVPTDWVGELRSITVPVKVLTTFTTLKKSAGKSGLNIDVAVDCRMLNHWRRHHYDWCYCTVTCQCHM